MVIDASVWTSAILATDGHHAVTTQWLAVVRKSHSSAWVPAHFPAEVIGAIRRVGAQSRTIQHELDWIFHGPFFEISVIDNALALLAAQVAERSALRGSDAIYVALAGWLQLPLISWNREQRERGEMFCRTMSPIEAMALNE